MATSIDDFIDPGFLQKIKYRDSYGRMHMIDLYTVLATEWTMVCDLIGISIADKNLIAKTNPNDPRICMEKVMEKWINEKEKYTRYSCTWNGIYKLLNDINKSTISEHLKEALKATKSSFVEPDFDIHDAADDGNKSEGDKPQFKDQSGENLKDFIKSKIKSPEKVTKFTAVINMAGLPEAGKTTLIDSLLGRQGDNKHSTDICEPTIVVDYDLKSSSTTATGNWEETDVKRSFGSDIGAMKSAEKIEGQSSPESLSDRVKNNPDGGAICDLFIIKINFLIITIIKFFKQIFSDCAALLATLVKSIQHDSYSDQPEVNDDAILGVVEKCEIKSFEELKTKSSLYIRDVGGQLEFKESLSLLVFGPSIYIFVFNPCFDIDLKQKIVYRMKSTREDEKEVREMVSYESMVSTKAALLQCLSSVQALQNTIGCDGQAVKSRVLIVGTHKDIWSVAASPSQFDKVSRIKNDLSDLSTKASKEADNLLNDLKSKLIEKHHEVESEADEYVKSIRNELKKICKKSDMEMVGKKIKISDIKNQLDVLNRNTYEKAEVILKKIKDIFKDSKPYEKAKLFVLRLFLPYDVETTERGLRQIFCSNESKINEELQKTIKENGFDHIVTSYRKSEPKEPMFAVNNFNTNDDGVKKLRKRITNILEGNDVFKFEYSTAEILFSLDLASSKKSVLTLDYCKNLAEEKWKIRDVEHLLGFLHSQVGVIQWFNSENLRNWVFKDSSLLYSMISKVIVATFINDSIENDYTSNQAEKLGIFQENVLQKIFTKEIKSRNQISELNWKTIIDVFIHLRLIARIKNTVDNKTDTTEYFLPCVLQPAALEYKEESGVIPTLFYSFECLNCPIGLFGALVATLMQFSTTIMGHKCEVSLNRKKQEEQLYKNQVVLIIYIDNYIDEILLRSHLSVVEVKYIPGSGNHSEKQCCTLARELIDKKIGDSLKLLRYDISKVKPQHSFMCNHCKEIHIPKKEAIHCDGNEDWKQVEEYWFNKKRDDSKESKSGPEEKDKTGKQYSWLWTVCSRGILLAIVVVVLIFGVLFLYGLLYNGFPLNRKPFQDPSSSTHSQEDPSKGICMPPDNTDPLEKFLRSTSQKKTERNKSPKPASKLKEDVISFVDWDTSYDLPPETYYGLDFAEVHGIGIKGNGVKLAIIDNCNAKYDGGIFEEHEALQTDSSCKIHSVRLDCSSRTNHALTVTSIAVGEPIHVAMYYDDKNKKPVEDMYPGGIAPEATATLFLINPYNKSSVLDALDLVIEGNFDVLSMSFVYSYEQVHDFEQRLDQLKGKTVVVAAAGNRGNTVNVGYPARHADVISIGSLNTYFRVSVFSAENKYVDLYYPGEVLSAIDHTKTSLKFSAGTSVATPGVAGVVCLLVEIANHHNYTDEIKEKKKVLSLLKHVVTTEQHGCCTIVYGHNTSFLKEVYGDENHFVQAMRDNSAM